MDNVVAFVLHNPATLNEHRREFGSGQTECALYGKYPSGKRRLAVCRLRLSAEEASEGSFLSLPTFQLSVLNNTKLQQA